MPFTSTSMVPIRHPKIQANPILLILGRMKICRMLAKNFSHAPTQYEMAGIHRWATDILCLQYLRPVKDINGDDTINKNQTLSRG